MSLTVCLTPPSASEQEIVRAPAMGDRSGGNGGAQVAEAELLDHPAVRAWRRLGQDRPFPTRVGPAQFKRRYPKTIKIYRLDDAAPGGGAVIAKHCKLPNGAIERIVYEEYLPRLAVTAAGYLGYLEDPSDVRNWLFMRELTGERYLPDQRLHRVYAARWLGALHAGAQTIGPRRGIPSAGPRHYLEHLRHARELIRTHRCNPVLTAEDVAFLDVLVGQFEDIERRWDTLESPCAAAPQTLAHGDFKGKNVFVQTAGEQPGIAVFDWEFAGWGPPAVDLAQFTGPAIGLGANPDLDTYWGMVRDLWPDHDRAEFERLAYCGTVFRILALLDWEASHLRHEYARGHIPTMQMAQPALKFALQRLDDGKRRPFGVSWPADNAAG
jgi:Phosphotransferase enzyme family